MANGLLFGLRGLEVVHGVWVFEEYSIVDHNGRSVPACREAR